MKVLHTVAPWLQSVPDETCAQLVERVRSCEECRDSLPLGPRPVLAAAPSSKILLIGQAPGIRVHESGVPWDDASGERLREWLGVSADQFYQPELFALLPMGFCYPGKGKTGDLPPRKECQPLWHPPLIEKLGQMRLVLLVGAYAQKAYLDESQPKTLTETVRRFKEAKAPRIGKGPGSGPAPTVFPLPHPSPLNNRWLAKNPWFAEELIPVLQREVANSLSE